ncbi:cysteine desulfurase [Devosia chinhatensis]|uniref:Cysteine desulfurase n=2 Tax=Devosia aurantiaca TaxID=2714858 RepID=A0A6M1SHD4_9HYPH|nr:cysteine desulfurase [Devosia aurantiaca]
MHPQVVEAMLTAGYGNPHSNSHSIGWDAAAKVERARESVAALINADADEIFFTSGATEANNLAILGVRKLRSERRDSVMRPAIEHKSVLAACDALVEEYGFRLDEVPVGTDGRIDLAYLAEGGMDRAVLMSVAFVNNEIGTIQDIAAIGMQRGPVMFHCDATQAPEGADIMGAAGHCDMMSISSHKMRGPMGIGALYISRSIQPLIKPIMYGGGQQFGIRPGTLPLQLCVGFGVACDIARNGAEGRKSLAKLRDAFIVALRKQGLEFELNGTSEFDKRHAGNANIWLPGVDAEQLLTLLQPGIAASTGSACTSGSLEPSYVLTSIGLSTEKASQSIRFSVGHETTLSDVNKAALMIGEAIKRLA